MVIFYHSFLLNAMSLEGLTEKFKHPQGPYYESEKKHG